MKKWFILSVMLGAFSLSGFAQDDDMYFVPSKQNVEREKATYGIPTDTYYSGSLRSVDEYNRRWSSNYEVLPVDTGDIVSFAAVEGVYPDSVGDFTLTKRMSRWDGYEPSAAYLAGYSRGYADSWGWHSPWFYSSYYPWYSPWYDPWYDFWYDPWYYGGYYGYYGYYGLGYPWYSSWGWGGYYGPYYNYYPYYVSWGGGHSVNLSTENHGRISGTGSRGITTGRTHTYTAGTFGSSRSVGTNRTTGGYGGSRSTNVGRTTTDTRTRTTASPSYSNSNGNFGGSRSDAGSFGGSRSSGGSVSSGGGGGGSFGGSSSGGGGGSRSGGGGGFGSGRR